MALLCALLFVGVPTAADAAGGGYSGPAPTKPPNPRPPRLPAPKPPTVSIDSVLPRFETDAVAGERDAADDMAIWVNPWDRGQSLVIGTDKAADALEVYDLTGNRLQRIADKNGSVNNVDLRYGFPLGGQFVDIVVSGGSDVAVYKIDPFTRQLVDVTARTITAANQAEGVCLYRSPFSGAFYVFTQAYNGNVEQLELYDNGFGQIDARSVRGARPTDPA
ncbi:MAG TPA: phytase, partial [Acidimicrobiia bacterium]|nr:phytase [Acidimicrobiia bacterium]